MDWRTSIGLSLRAIRVGGGDEEMGGAMDLLGESEGGREGSRVRVGEKQRLQLLIGFESMRTKRRSVSQSSIYPEK